MLFIEEDPSWAPLAEKKDFEKENTFGRNTVRVGLCTRLALINWMSVLTIEREGSFLNSGYDHVGHIAQNWIRALRRAI